MANQSYEGRLAFDHIPGIPERVWMVVSGPHTHDLIQIEVGDHLEIYENSLIKIFNSALFDGVVKGINTLACGKVHNEFGRPFYQLLEGGFVQPFAIITKHHESLFTSFFGGD